MLRGHSRFVDRVVTGHLIMTLSSPTGGRNQAISGGLAPERLPEGRRRLGGLSVMSVCVLRHLRAYGSSGGYPGQVQSDSVSRQPVRRTVDPIVGNVLF